MLDQLAPVRSAAERLSVSRLPDAARFVLRGNPGTLVVPREACRADVAAERAALWLGPDEWLLLTTAPDADALRAALGDAAHALVDVSDRQLGIGVHGPKASALLNVFCPLDLRARRFPAGACTRTVFAKCEVVLWRRAHDAFHVEVWRSFVPYVEGLLHQALPEFA